MKNNQSEMYGIPDIDLYIERSIKTSFTYKTTGANMIVAGLMSDAQEFIANDCPESARQTLNIAKAVLFKIMDGQLVADVAR